MRTCPSTIQNKFIDGFFCSMQNYFTEGKQSLKTPIILYIFWGWGGLYCFVFSHVNAFVRQPSESEAGDEYVAFFLFWYDKASSGGLGVVFAPDVTSAFGSRSFHVLYSVRLIEVTHAADCANTWWSFHPKINVTSSQLTTCRINYWQFWERKPRT